MTLGCLRVAMAMAISGNDHVGWGFEKHGGFPVNPWHSWAMNLSTTAYFVGNASGMDSPAELQGEIKLGYVGIGWQLNNIPSHYSHLETYEIEEAKILKNLRPDIKVSVLRNTEVATVFWDTAKAKMFDPTTQDWWTQCPQKNGTMAPCVGSWGSPAGNTPKYWFNFSNPDLVDWWVNTYIGEAVNQTVFDGVYFDCCCGKAPGVPVSAAAQFAADAQAAFDRALRLIASANKWASAWNSDGAISQKTCSTVMAAWMKKGANPAVSLQPLAPAFKGHGTPPGPAPKPLQCGDSCTLTVGVDTHNTGIVAPPVKMPNQENFTHSDNVAECCSRCQANTNCEVFELGPGGCVPGTNCTASTINCFLIGGYTGIIVPNSHRATGCVRAPPSPSPSSWEMEQNNTVAAFMIARGPSAMLELPVGGAYENMAMYDVDAPVLQLDFGAAVGLGTEEAPGIFTRQFQKGVVRLDCNTYTSVFSSNPP
eukprot:m.76005 g.76005  ORF g.76005 m.76005 type:complete len:480 (-) comp10476_c1_seq1:158-1597(-)